MPLMTNLDFLTVEEEAVPGAIEPLVDATFEQRIYDLVITPTVEIDDESAKYATGDHGETLSLTGARMATISFRCRMSWGGDVTTEPKWWDIAEGCGCSIVNFTTVGRALEPCKAQDGKTLTMRFLRLERGATPAALEFAFAGCMGNMVMQSEGVGKPWNVLFTFTGKLATVTDVANGSIPALTSPDTVAGERMLSNTVSLVGLSAQKISSFSLDIGNEITPEIDQSEATGYKLFNITSRKPRLSVNPLQELVATGDYYGKFTTESTGTGASSITTTGTPPRFTLIVPNGQIITLAQGAREGLGNWDVNIKCLRNGTTSASIEDESSWQLLQGAVA